MGSVTCIFTRKKIREADIQNPYYLPSPLKKTEPIAVESSVERREKEEQRRKEHNEKVLKSVRSNDSSSK